MNKRGRPRGVSSIETRRRIIETARVEFSEKGFDGASIAQIAAQAQLAPSAIYNHYESKSKLYVAVFEDSADNIWAEVSSARLEITLVEAVMHLIESSRYLKERLPNHNNFLASVPIEARLHPEFSPLLNRRTKYQDETFNALATIGINTGELEGFTIEEGREFLRALIMGWFFERHFRGKGIPGSGEAIIKAVKVLTDSSHLHRSHREYRKA